MGDRTGLRDIEGSVPNYHNKAKIETVKITIESHEFFGFPVH